MFDVRKVTRRHDFFSSVILDGKSLVILVKIVDQTFYYFTDDAGANTSQQVLGVQ